MADKISLTDLFDIKYLQTLQDSFSNAMNISAGISDENGVAITKHRCYGEFCDRYIKCHPEGLKRCQESDRNGALLARKAKEPVIYICHAGLSDFAAPIVINDVVYGSFHGGQVIEGGLDEEKMREFALAVGEDPEEMITEAKKLSVWDHDRLQHAAEFLYNIGNMMSHMAYRGYNIALENLEIEREAHMKSDFLANMSHEIRTPMNAVIGMAQMALREDLPPAAREYINQIKTAGNTLLTIINDILDFSKIESGKMDINLAEYQPASIINDITNIIQTRIGEKRLDLIVDFDPDIPEKLMGDSIRINQVILNLANNAVKFTREGMVKIKVGCEKKDDRQYLLNVLVEDTGIGIREEDMGKLFQSFQQVDSKRNRNIEGSGLGLAISKQLVSLMNGEMGFTSQYGVGSTFYFSIPQFSLFGQKSVIIDHPELIKVAFLSDNENVNTSLVRDFKRFGIDYSKINNFEDIESFHEQAEDFDCFLFLDYPMFSEQIFDFLVSHSEMNAVLMVDYRDNVKVNLPNLVIVKKPMYSLNIANILNHKELYEVDDGDEEEICDFIAPQAQVLIVDDNEVNLTVAAGMMEPYQLQIEKARGGKEAIDLITRKHYDLVFMDHMMPDIDGVETTRIIRRLHQEYNDVPIIALTANVMEETRSMFLVEGMNDYLAKPIEIKRLNQKLKQWLPQNKIQLIDMRERKNLKKMAEDVKFLDSSLTIDVPGLDVPLALSYLGSEKLFWKALEDFYHYIPKKSDAIQKTYETKDWKHYTIEVHALKSAAKQIGAIPLSDQAAMLEHAGKEGDILLIEQYTEKLLRKYRSYRDTLQEYFPEQENVSQKKVTDEEVISVLQDMLESLDNLDVDGMEHGVNCLKEFCLDAKQEQYRSRLSEAVRDLDVECCEEIIFEWQKCFAN